MTGICRMCLTKVALFDGYPQPHPRGLVPSGEKDCYGTDLPPLGEQWP